MPISKVRLTALNIYTEVYIRNVAMKRVISEQNSASCIQ